jgi:hypothetical protein
LSPKIHSITTDAISACNSVRTLHDLGDSWPEAIRLVVDVKGRVAYALIAAGQALYEAGESILMGQLKEAEGKAMRGERERDDAALAKLGRAFDATDIAEASSWATTARLRP